MLLDSKFYKIYVITTDHEFHNIRALSGLAYSLKNESTVVRDANSLWIKNGILKYYKNIEIVLFGSQGNQQDPPQLWKI